MMAWLWLNNPIWRWLLFGLLVAGYASTPLPCSVAQTSARHYLTGTDLPAGSIGQARQGRHRGAGYFQPVRIQAPLGALVAVASAAEFESHYPSPAQFGLQVGNTYRFQISAIPLLAGSTLYPTVEMIDRLHPPPGRKGEFPIPIELTLEELRRASEGALITRVIYVDDPRNPAFEAPGNCDQPYFEVFPTEDPLVVADELGRPVAILRIGAKAPPPGGPDADFLFHAPPVEERSDFAMGPGTIHEPTAPVVCPTDLCGETDCPPDEYLCDGGDEPYHASVNRRGEILGLEPSETIARFTTIKGEIHTTSGNRVCIYAPRFAATRKTLRANQEELIDRVGSVQDPVVPAHATWRSDPTPATRHLELLQAESTRIGRTLEDSNRGLLLENRNAALANVRMVLPHANLADVSASVLESRDLARELEGTANAISWSSAQTVQVVLEGAIVKVQDRTRQPQAIDLYEMPPGKPCLRIIKLASTDAAHKGAWVTFTLRFHNLSDTPISEVSIIDNLLPRLVYQEGSQSCSLEADFTRQPGSEGSTLLTWTLLSPLEAGHGGEIKFRCQAE